MSLLLNGVFIRSTVFVQFICVLNTDTQTRLDATCAGKDRVYALYAGDATQKGL